MYSTTQDFVYFLFINNNFHNSNYNTFSAMIRKMKELIKNHHLRKNAVLFLLALGVIATGLIIIWFSSLKIPDFSSFEERKVINSTKIYDRTGEILLYDINQDVKR